MVKAADRQAAETSSSAAEAGAEQVPTAKRARTSGSKAAMTTKTSKASAAKSGARTAKATTTKAKATAGAAKAKATTATKKATGAKTSARSAASKSASATRTKATAAKAPASAKASKTKSASAATAKAKTATRAKAAEPKKSTTSSSKARSAATKTTAASAAPKKAASTSIKRAGGGKKPALGAPSAAPGDALARAQEHGDDITLPELVEVGREVLGISELRPGQGEALEHILAKRDVLAVMPTGSGKSLLYQLPSLALPGLTVVVSPLIALIKDQIDKMTARGVAVVRIDSTLTVKQRREMDALARAPGGKLLLTTPERMADPEFREMLRDSAEGVGVSLFVVDEAHCVSQWGHDFRPSYLTLRKSIEDLGRPPILATTATAPPHVREDILHQLGTPEAEVVTTTFDRPNLHYECIAVPGDDDKNKTLVTLLKRLPRPGIVYCATVKKVEELYESLSRHGIPVARYHGRLTKKERDANQNEFMAAKDVVMIATNAFGLGVDKPDIRYVLHYHVPGSLEAYAQEAGRGGRDGRPARCVLLFSPDDVAIQEYFLTGTYPSRRQVRAVYKTLEAWSSHQEAQPTVANLAVSSHVGAQRTRTVLSLLKDEGFVVEHGEALFALADPPPDEKLLTEKAKQYEARRVADRQRLDALLDYVGAAGCRSQAILSYLGEDDTPECGRCDNCLRSRDAAIAAAREAARLEDGVIRRLTAEDEEADEVPRSKRLVRTRLIRIDDPAALAQIEAQEAAAAPPTPTAKGEPPVRNGQSRKSPNELAALIAEQEDDDARAWQKQAPPAEADDEYEDDDEYDEELADDEEYEDDDEYEYVDDDEEYEDDDEYVIDKTAAALAEEGYEPEETEITILARKKVAKPAKQPSRPTLEEPKKPRKRRRRRKKNLLPSKDSFTSPVLTKEQAPPPKHERRHRRGAAPAGPLVEYVRGPLRINMTPVASATPNDVARRKNTNFKFKKRRRPAGGEELPIGVRPPPAPPSVATEEPGKKKRRRRRRKKRRGTGQTAEAGAETPIDFFSSSSDPSPTGKKRRKRRRRRRGGSGKAPGPGGGGAPAGD